MRPTGISIGDFNFRVTFYTQTKGAVDALGNPTLSLGSAVERWANVAYKKGSAEGIETGREYPEWFEMEIRKPFTVNQGDRVDFDGLNLTITSVSSDDKNKIKIKAVGIE